MQVNSLFSYKDHIHRVLALSDSSALLIHCQKHTMPFWIPLSELTDNQQYSEEDLLSSAHIVPVNALSPQKKKLAHQRFTVISPILPFISTDSIRSLLISQIAKDNNLTKQTVRKYLCLYLAYQTISALIPSEKETAPLSQDEKNFRWALNRYFYSSLKHGLKGTYELMLKEKYTDAAGALLDTHPPFHRFRYDIYIPSPMSAEIYTKLYLSFVRSLQKKESRTAILQGYENRKLIRGQPSQGIIGGSDSYTILGVSGIGKSIAISRAISIISQDSVLMIGRTKIIPFLIVQTPADCSIKGLLYEVLRTIDGVLDTRYYADAVRSRATLDTMIGIASQVCLNHLCVLIIDEAQHLVSSKNSKTLINAISYS